MQFHLFCFKFLVTENFVEKLPISYLDLKINLIFKNELKKFIIFTFFIAIIALTDFISKLALFIFSSNFSISYLQSFIKSLSYMIKIKNNFMLK